VPLAVGSALGAAVTGGLLATAARAVAPPPYWLVLAAVGTLALLALADVRGRRGLTFPRRQTSADTVRWSGQRLGQAIWGFDLALGVTTYRTSRLYWGALVLLVVAGSPWFCLAGTIAYAAAFLVSLRRSSYFVVREDWMVRRRRQLGTAGFTVAVVVAIVGVVGG
jgi:hypothetical protein